jgi:hypothetical protein
LYEVLISITETTIGEECGIDTFHVSLHIDSTFLTDRFPSNRKEHFKQSDTGMTNSEKHSFSEVFVRKFNILCFSRFAFRALDLADSYTFDKKNRKHIQPFFLVITIIIVVFLIVLMRKSLDGRQE